MLPLPSLIGTACWILLLAPATAWLFVALMPRLVFGAVLEVRVRDFLTVAEPALNRLAGRVDPVLTQIVVSLAGPRQCDGDVAVREPATGPHGAKPKGALVQSLVSLTGCGAGEFALDLQQRCQRIGSAALVVGIVGSVGGVVAGVAGGGVVGGVIGVVVGVVGVVLHTVPDNVLHPPWDWRCAILEEREHRWPASNLFPSPAIGERRARGNDEASCATNVAARRKLTAAVAERLTIWLVKVQVQAATGRRAHHGDAARQAPMPRDKVFEREHAIDGARVAIQVDDHDVIDATRYRWQGVRRPRPPLADLGGVSRGNLLP